MRALFPLVLVLHLSCTPLHMGPPSDPAHIDDAIPEESCRRAESKLLELQCKDDGGRLIGGANRKGERFYSICVVAVQRRVSIRPGCIARAVKCTDVDACTGAQ